jgi:addiction module HigA family antidote
MLMFDPPHPGCALRERMAELSVRLTASHLGISRERLTRILKGRSRINADMALRLSEAFGTSAEVWMGMQNSYGLWRASKKRRKKIARFRTSPA